MKRSCAGLHCHVCNRWGKQYYSVKGNCNNPKMLAKHLIFLAKSGLSSTPEARKVLSTHGRYQVY